MTPGVGRRIVGEQSGAVVRGYPKQKLWLNRLGNFLIRVLFRMSYNDTTNTATLTRTAGGLLPDGAYRATVHAGSVTDAAGNIYLGGSTQTGDYPVTADAYQTKFRSAVPGGIFGGINAPYIWVKTPNGLTSWQMFDRMLRDLSVVITPGAGFGAQGEGYFRISAFNSRANAEEVARRVERP